MKAVFRLVDDLNEQFFGLLLTSSMKAVQLIRRTVTAVCTASNNDPTSSSNIWQSYKQERDYFVHFLCLLAVCWPSAQSARDNHVLACNFAKYSPIINFSLSDSAINLA